jgi:hypothetical protein
MLYLAAGCRHTENTVTPDFVLPPSLRASPPKGFHGKLDPGYFFQLFLSPPVFRNRPKKTCAAMCAGRSNTADDPSVRKGYTGTANRKVGHAHFDGDHGHGTTVGQRGSGTAITKSFPGKPCPRQVGFGLALTLTANL